MENNVKAEDVVLGHVEMSMESYARIASDRRAGVWADMIAKIGITVPYLPIPYQDDTTDTIGMNLVGIPAVSETRSQDDTRHAE